MITRENLSTVKMNIESDKSVWHNVTAPDGRKFVLSSADITEKDLDNMDPFSAMLYFSMPEYMRESVVYNCDADFNIVGDCDERCGEGMCTKRIAQDRTVGSIDRAYELLLSYLNS